MKHNHLFLTLLLTTLAVGCGKDKITISRQECISETSFVPFTLTATQGESDTRLSFDSDGLNTTWQPGDKLYMVDLAGQNNTVTLETTITEPSKSASFVSKTSVLSGDYVVLYGTSLRESNHPTHTMSDLTALSSRIKLYGTVSVTDGQTSAAIHLSHVFAKLTFKFKNVPTGLRNVSCGMMELNGDIPTVQKGIIGPSGWVNTSETSVSRWNFAWNNGSDAAIFVAPVNLTGKRLYFYIYGDDNYDNHLTYEYIKDGIDLKAGTNYNLTFDFSSPTNSTTLTKSNGTYTINSPAHFRAAAYWNSGKAYRVTTDVNFSGEAVFPILTSRMYGDNKTLSNITIDWAKRDTVGLLSQGSADDLILKNVTVKGKKYVGGIAGFLYNTSLANCEEMGDISILGESYTGGMIGFGSVQSGLISGNLTVTGGAYTGGISGSGSVSGCRIVNGGISGESYTGGIAGSGTVTSCTLEDNCTITGTERTGGIVGYTTSTISGCKIGKNLKVIGTDSVGGLAGYVYGPSIIISDFLLRNGAMVSGTTNVGGLVGYCYGSTYSSSNSVNAALLKCGFEGTVSATSDNAGGLIGYVYSGTIEKSYAVANVTADNYAGGLVGQGRGSSYCFNSYSIGNITTPNYYTHSGGISGYNSNIKYCYSYGSIENGYGICPNLDNYYTSYNLTSESAMGATYSNSAYCDCGPNKTYLSLLNVINGDEAYSTQVWANIDAKCPLLQWQSDLFGGEIVAPGFGDENW